MTKHPPKTLITKAWWWPWMDSVYWSAIAANTSLSSLSPVVVLLIKNVYFSLNGFLNNVSLILNLIKLFIDISTYLYVFNWLQNTCAGKPCSVEYKQVMKRWKQLWWSKMCKGSKLACNATMVRDFFGIHKKSFLLFNSIRCFIHIGLNKI